MQSHRTTARRVLLPFFLGLAAALATPTALAVKSDSDHLGPRDSTTPQESASPKSKAPRLIFPVVGPVQFTDDFGAPRTGHAHQGNDIMAPKRSLAVAVENGTVKFGSGGTAGCYLYLYGANKTYYLYIHLNNDLTKRNDNRGKCVPGVSFYPGLKNGQKVRAGEPIGYVGDSGDANGVAPHLHFEVHPRGGGAVSPYPYLIRAFRLLFAAPRGTIFKLSLDGAVMKTSIEQVGMKVVTLRAQPTGFKFVGVNRSIQVTVPDTTLLERKVSGVTRTMTAPLTSLKKNVPMQLWTQPTMSTLDALMGKQGALSARRIIVLR